jgi:hypothetical protein
MAPLHSLRKNSSKPQDLKGLYQGTSFLVPQTPPNQLGFSP